jgi:hypothetical protein
MSGPVDVLAVPPHSSIEVTDWTCAQALAFAVNALREHHYRRDIVAKVQESAVAVAELIEAVRPHVAMTFDEARAADDRGERPIFCQCDVLNPCWAPGMPITVPLRHWGYTPDMAGDGLACPDCRLRAALANVGSAS